MDVITSLKMSLRLAKDREHTLEEELLVLRTRPNGTNNTSGKLRTNDWHKTCRCMTCRVNQSGRVYKQEKHVLQRKPYSIDKSAVTTNCWWQEVPGRLPEWNSRPKQEPHLVKPKCCERDVEVADNHCNDRDKSKQNPDCFQAETDCGSVCGLVKEETNQLSCPIRNVDVASSPDKDVQVIKDQLSDDPRCREGLTTMSTRLNAAHRARLRDESDRTIRYNQKNDYKDTARATRTPVFGDQEMLLLHNSPERIDGPEKTIRQTTEDTLTSCAREFSTASDKKSSAKTSETPGKGSSMLLDRKRTTVQNEVDPTSSHINAYDLVETELLWNKHATDRTKTELLKTQPNNLLSSVTETGSLLVENTRGEKNFGSRATNYRSWAAKGGTISVRNSTANSNRITDKKPSSEAHSLSSRVTRTDVKPAIASIIKTLSSSSQDLSFTRATEKMLNVIPTKDKVDEGINSKVSDTVPTAVKHTEESAVQENWNNVQYNKAINSNTIEQDTSTLSKTSRFPRRFNQNDSSGFNHMASIDQANYTRGAETDINVVDPLAVKLVHVAQLLHSVPPAAPENIRNTGIATPALQAQKLGTSYLPTPQNSPRNMQIRDTTSREHNSSA